MSDNPINEMYPKLIDNWILNLTKIQNSPKIDVYSYGVILHFLFTGKLNYDEDLMFPDDIDHKWEILIKNCLKGYAHSRPSFIKICKQIEEIFKNKSIDKDVFNNYKAQFVTFKLKNKKKEKSKKAKFQMK